MSLKYSQVKVYKKIWENNIQKHENNIYNTSDESLKSLMKRLHNQNLVGTGYLSSLQFILVSVQHCDIAISKDTLYAYDFSFPVNKNFPHLEIFKRNNIF